MWMSVFATIVISRAGSTASYGISESSLNPSAFGESGLWDVGDKWCRVINFLALQGMPP